MQLETIAAIATPPGRGGVAIIRLSGKKVPQLIPVLFKKELLERKAELVHLYGENGEVLDQGIALFFPAPHSFTGEDVLEFHGHGGPVLVQQILLRIYKLAVRPARPGEFSERAFLNNKMDLTQAEAIADLIDASSVQATRAAMQSLQGAFSSLIRDLVEQLISLRVYIEAALDFSEEEINFLAEDSLKEKTKNIIGKIEQVISETKQGTLLKEGMTLVIAGKPNAGKSSILNALSDRDLAIVTEIPGTTRDVLRQEISLDGLPIHVVDTAGLRETNDKVELEGIRRAYIEIKKADRVLWIVDSSQKSENEIPTLPECDAPITIVVNKIDLADEKPRIVQTEKGNIIYLSAKFGQGMALLKQHLKEEVGYSEGEGKFIARTRHLQALINAREFLTKALENLNKKREGELIAEELRQAQNQLNEITGEFSNDDLLGRIFSSFCIGK